IIQEEITASGASRAITKKYYVADRKLELISARLKKRPFTIVETLSDLGLVRPQDILSTANAIGSYCVGCVLGRWDVRYSIGMAEPHKPAEINDPIPACPAAMLQGNDHLPLTEAPAGYPLRVETDVIVTDDPDHPDDIVRRLREVLELVWKDRAEDIEKEICE